MESYNETVAYIKSKLPKASSSLSSPTIGIVCGSGLGGLASCLSAPVSLPYSDIPNFYSSTVQGHDGALVFGLLGDKACVCMVGRFHFYEGNTLASTVFPIRIMKMLGISVLIVTNAAGGVNRTYSIGDVMVIADHISFAGYECCACERV
jgi:purine-nucleoside phosphorylase